MKVLPLILLLALAASSMFAQDRVVRKIRGQDDVTEARRSIRFHDPSKDQEVEITMVARSNDEVWFSGWSNGFSLQADQLEALAALLNKALRWDKIAREHQVEPFRKVVGMVGDTPLVFSYVNGRTRLSSYDLEPVSIENLLKLLPEYPAAKKEADEKKKKRDAEDELFQ